MTFFTTPELLEIGDMPFSSPNQKPTRNEALEYYRKVAALQARRPPVRDRRPRHRRDGTSPSTRSTEFGREPDTAPASSSSPPATTTCPTTSNIPGEDLPKVKHYYNEPHPYFGLDVLVIGGKNSAAIAALDLWRHGARVTLVHRGAEMHRHVKYWIKPDIENRIKNGEDHRLLSTRRHQNHRRHRHPRHPRRPAHHPNHFVFALTGYHPDFDFIESPRRHPRRRQRPLPHLRSRHPRKSTSPASTSPASSSPANAPTRSSSRTAASTANKRFGAQANLQRIFCIRDDNRPHTLKSEENGRVH
jgi:thioredoxin reductase (NADPH)